MRRGFTLIEVLVTMAIITILTGMMVPAVWKWWEGQEIQTTRERLQALKIAMVGDRTLVQNGIRTSYGYVGDFGELPVQARLSSASLHPYIPGGYSSESFKDAWGHDFRYTAYDNLDGYDNRVLSGRICSDGLDGIPNTPDDLCVELPVSEVAPTYRIQGNFVFSNTQKPISSARLRITFKNSNDPSGESSGQVGCKQTFSFSNFTTLFPLNGAPANIPIGKVTIESIAYRNKDCTNPYASNHIDYFVADNMNRLLINIPTLTEP